MLQEVRLQLVMNAIIENFRKSGRLYFSDLKLVIGLPRTNEEMF